MKPIVKETNRTAVSSSFRNDKSFLLNADTIAAIATPVGEGAIGIVRLSGPDAVTIVDECFRGRTMLRDARSHSLVYGFIIDENGRRIDECLAGVMKGPDTFTGEDVVEINCHGGALVVETVLNRVLELGGRPAAPGEFSQRAYLNGKLDLSQAEAIIDIVRAKSPQGLRLAADQLHGTLSRKVESVRRHILDVLARIQVVIDYPEEGVDELPYEELRTLVIEAKGEIDRLLATSDAGRVYRDGIRLSIVGRPNVGKSSLLNALLQEDRAIVTDVAGTTRDPIEAPALLGGIPVTLTDTAGLRDTEDPVEKIGVERTRRAMDTADLLFAVLDGTEPLTNEDYDILKIVRSKMERSVPTIIVMNKRDAGQKLNVSDIVSFFESEVSVVSVSAVTGDGLDHLEEEAAKKILGDRSISTDDLVVTRSRHRLALRRAQGALEDVLAGMDEWMTEDVLSIDLQESLAALGEITGAAVGEDVVARIFEQFCVGK